MDSMRSMLTLGVHLQLGGKVGLARLGLPTPRKIIGKMGECRADHRKCFRNQSKAVVADMLRIRLRSNPNWMWRASAIVGEARPR